MNIVNFKQCKLLFTGIIILEDKCNKLLRSTKARNNANISQAERELLLQYVKEHSSLEMLVDIIAHNSVSSDVITELKSKVDSVIEAFVSSSHLARYDVLMKCTYDV